MTTRRTELPVLNIGGDGTHHPSCGGCLGKGDADSCVYSIRLRRRYLDAVDEAMAGYNEAFELINATINEGFNRFGPPPGFNDKKEN